MIYGHWHEGVEWLVLGNVPKGLHINRFFHAKYPLDSLKLPPPLPKKRPVENRCNFYDNEKI